MPGGIIRLVQNGSEDMYRVPVLNFCVFEMVPTKNGESHCECNKCKTAWTRVLAQMKESKAIV
jgi:hypothetical protein